MNIFVRTLRDRRAALGWWLLGLIVYCGFIVAVWPVIDGNNEFGDLYADMPEAFQAMFGSDGFSDFTSPVGFATTYLFSMILPFILTGLAVSMGASVLAGEEEDGLVELVLAYPVRRRRLVVEKALAIATAVGGVGLAVSLFLALAREPVSLDLGMAGLLSATLGSVLFATTHGMIALCVGAWQGSKGAATGAAWGLALAGYLLNILANLDEKLEGLRYASPLYWATAGDPLDGNLPATYSVLVGAFVGLLVLAVALFERHDLK
ncbi:MAG: ABC transporter permease subunit [Acidimicrobiales bacterium]